ncbi:hypothetical protein K474DRAFT_1668472 [Panus rudis PR-1116 ss-1]|nr:hypothetical protein K474DRAFT_1668472 [Panus rudis PR-1116 ss-1]
MPRTLARGPPASRSSALGSLKPEGADPQTCRGLCLATPNPSGARPGSLMQLTSSLRTADWRPVACPSRVGLFLQPFRHLPSPILSVPFGRPTPASRHRSWGPPD